MKKSFYSYEMDWIKFYDKFDLEILEVFTIEDALAINSQGNPVTRDPLRDFYIEHRDGIVKLRILNFKLSTRYFTSSVLLEAVKKEKTNNYLNTRDWENLGKIKWGNMSEQALFEADIIYKEFLNKLEKKLKEPVQKHEELLISNLSPRQVELLYMELRTPENSFILAESELEHFTKIFMPEVIEKKIVWLMMTKKGKREIPNKLSLCELFFELRDAKLVNFKNATLLRFLPQKFKPFEGEFTNFDYNNLPTATNTSQFSETIHKIVIRVKKALG